MPAATAKRGMKYPRGRVLPDLFNPFGLALGFVGGQNGGIQAFAEGEIKSAAQALLGLYI